MAKLSGSTKPEDIKYWKKKKKKEEEEEDHKCKNTNKDGWFKSEHEHVLLILKCSFYRCTHKRMLPLD